MNPGYRGTSKSPKRYSRSQHYPSSNTKSNKRHSSQQQHNTWHQNQWSQDDQYRSSSCNLQNVVTGNQYVRKMQNKEPNKGEEPPDEIRRLSSEMAVSTTTNSAERRIARYKEDRRRQLATQIANRLSSNRSFSSSSSTASSDEDQFRGNGKQKRKRGSLESCSGGSGSLGKLSAETNLSGAASRSISNKSCSSYSKYKRYQRSRRPNNQEPTLPPSLTNTDNKSSTLTLQDGTTQNNSVPSSAPRRRRRKSFNYDPSHCSASSDVLRRGKSPAAKAQREKKLSAAQLGDADGEDDDYDDEIGIKEREQSQRVRAEREGNSPEHIYHQIGSDSLIRVSKKPSSFTPKVSRSSKSSSFPARLGNTGDNTLQRNEQGGIEVDPEILTKNDRLEQENNEILLKIKEIKSKIKDIKKPARTESFNTDLQRYGKKSNSSHTSNHSPRSRFLTRAQSFDDKCTEYSNEDRSCDDTKVFPNSHRPSRNCRKSSLPRGNWCYYNML